MIPLVLVFVRWPEPGTTKTRLAATIGDEQAAHIYDLMAQEQVFRLKGAVSESTYRMLIYGTPVERLAKTAAWLNDGQAPYLNVMHQPERTLGERLAHGADWAFERLGAPSVIFIGSDCPDISSDILLSAKELLTENDAVVGRANDGGFYLLGMRRSAPGVLENVAYSSDETCTSLVGALRGQGLTCDDATLPQLSDVDTVDDFKAISSKARERLLNAAADRGMDFVLKSEWLGMESANE